MVPRKPQTRQSLDTKSATQRRNTDHGIVSESVDELLVYILSMTNSYKSCYREILLQINQDQLIKSPNMRNSKKCY